MGSITEPHDSTAASQPARRNPAREAGAIRRQEKPVSTTAISSLQPVRRTLSHPLAYALSAAIIGLALFASATPSRLLRPTVSWGSPGRRDARVRHLRHRRPRRSPARRASLRSARPRRGLLTASRAHHGQRSHARRRGRGRSQPAPRRAGDRAGTGTASAALLDFHPRHDPSEAGLTNGSVSAAGLGLGALVSAAAVQLLPAPRALPDALVLALFAIAFIGALLMPEPVAERAPLRLTPQRPHVPPEVRQPLCSPLSPSPPPTPSEGSSSARSRSSPRRCSTPTTIS